MDTLSFYTPAVVTLEDIAICAMKAGFKTYYAPPSTVRLMIEFLHEYEDEIRASAWAVWESDILQLRRENPVLVGDWE